MRRVALLALLSLATMVVAVPDITLRDTAGRSHSLTALASDRPLILLAIGKECPHSRSAQPIFEALRELYRGKANVVGVIDAPMAEAQAWVREHDAKMPVLVDPDKRLIGEAEFRRACQFSVFARGGELIKRYPGYNKAVFRELASKLGPGFPILSRDDVRERLTAGCMFR